MGKDKKGKKGKQEEDFGEEEVDVESAKGAGNDNASGNTKVVRKGKKGRKKDDDWEEDVAKELEALSLDNNIASDLKSATSKNEAEDKKLMSDEPDFSFPSKKEKKKKKGVEFDGEDADEEVLKTKQSKNQRGKKGKNEGSDEDNEDFKKDSKGARKKGKAFGSDDEGEDEMINGKLSKKQKGKKSKQLSSDEEDIPVQKKDNKGSKKKSKGVISDDEELTEQTEKIQPKKQKGRKAKGDFSDEEIEHMMEQKKDSKVNKKKGGKGKGDLSEDETDDADIKTKRQKDKGEKVRKKGKKTKNKVADSDDEEPALKGKTTKKDNVGKIKPKTGFQLLETEDMDLDDDSNDDMSLETETIAAPEKDTKLKNQLKQDSVDIEDQDIEVKKDDKGSKKSKKKERRKKEDEEEVDKMLEELAMEIEGKKPPEKVKEKAKDGTEDTVAEGELKPEEISEKQSKKKKKKKGDLESQEEKKMEDKEPEVEETVEEEDRTVKTAAQKKKEKKERERQKKLAQNEQDRSKKKGDAKTEETKPDDKAEKVEKEDTEALTVLDEDDADDKKKKKKKKKDEEEKKDKKRPGKKQIAAMQEALKKVKEEEERLRLEEEAKQKAAEEAEQKRQEKLRLEQERKEKKKQKEKEKRERLKAEGKLLTRSQRQARARMEATLQALRQQGVEVPQIGEKKERAPRLGDRKRQQKKKADEQDSTVELQKVEVEIIGPSEQKVELPEHEGNVLEKENKEAINDIDVNETLDTEVKEAWDETTEDEGEDDDEDDENILSKAETKVVKTVSKQPKKEESEEETEESESEEESSTEKSESEEESSDESEEEEEGKKQEAKIKERAAERIMRRREEAEKNRSTSKLRSPVVCVLGHVDTGKTKILDKIRRTHVQDSEAGGITQQIGATMVPQDALKEQCKMVKNFADVELKVPGLLIIDTPGHESFSNLRSRGSSLCDIAILVVDIMHGLEPQTIESLNLLKQKKTPFIVALNKVDRLYEWKTVKNKDIQDVIKSQARNTKMEFEDRAKDVILQFANQGMNATLFYENKDPRSYISMVPTSAFTGDGMGNLMALIVELTQSMMAKRLAFSEELQATVLEVKAIPGLGTTIDVILVNGRLREGDTILLAAHDGPLVTQIRSLLMPQPLKELRVKNPYQEYKEVEGAQGVKIAGKDLDKAIAGLQLLVAHHPDEVEVLKDEVSGTLREAMSSIKLAERGVYVQASTLGSLEALLEFLKVSKIPYSGIRIGPVVKKDVMKASIMLEHDSQYAVILAFDVKVERDAQELADNLGVKIFQADIIYHLFDKFMAYRDELKQKKRDEFKNIAVFPCKLRILPQYVFNSRDPIVVGVIVEAGVIKDGTPLCVPSKEFLEIGTVTTIEVNHKSLETARRGQEVCIKIEPSGGEAPKMYGRHFDHTDMLVSKITRQSIDVCKEYFRDDLLKTDWQLMVELKKIFQIL